MGGGAAGVLNGRQEKVERSWKNVFFHPQLA